MTLRTLFSEVIRSKVKRPKHIELRRKPKVSPNASLWSVVTCPSCGCNTLEAIPEATAVLRYTCTECETVLEPAAWECCVYCSYGSVRCAKVQSRT